jgi:predicted Rossmann fold flavoprotein
VSGGWDAIVLGAGAAGLMAAAEAGKRGKKVLLLERGKRPGAKILVSGGGRCNFTNMGADASHYLSQNPHFAKSALARYGPKDFLKLLERHRIPWHEKKLGQLFCDRSAQDILDMLLKECREAGVELRCGVDCPGAVWQGGEFEALEFRAPKLIVATGGLSFPKLGATDFAQRLARSFGHAVVPTRPALDGFVFAAEEKKAFEGLSGVSAEAECGKFKEALLFTHLGLSGPLALQASLYWQAGQELRVRFHGRLPKRLEARFRELKLDPQDWRFIPASTVGYAKAEVTKGGVDCRQLSSQSMESSRQPGLFFIGEAVDVTGELGGYNFQWAWSSAVAAAGALG